MKTTRKGKVAKQTRAARRAGNAPDGSDPMFDGLSAADLKDLSARVESAIAERRTAQRSELRASFRAMAEAAGYTLAEVVGKARGNSDGVKFVNPDNRSETWSGRGRMPNWLATRLKAGTSLEDFRVA
jgi:DNA-binding protein H-NS